MSETSQIETIKARRARNRASLNEVRPPPKRRIGAGEIALFFALGLAFGYLAPRVIIAAFLIYLAL